MAQSIALICKFHREAELYTKRFFSRSWPRHTRPQTGILMLNMGGPQSLEEVRPFLTRLFTDEDIMSFPFQSKLGPYIAKKRGPVLMDKYKQIGGRSPIKFWTDTVGLKMVKILDKISPKTAPHQYYIAFRYAHPLTEEAIEQMENDQVERVIAFSQYPQYSCSTSGSSFNAIAHYYKDHAAAKIMKWSFIDRFPTNFGLIESFRQLILDELSQFNSNDRDKVVLLFSAHALPLSKVDVGDPYPSEVGATVISVMKSLNFSNPYFLVWQSKVGPARWLSPQIDTALKGLVKNGYKNFLIVPISFINEHIETLHELDIEYCNELAEELKIKNIRRASTPNDHPAFIEGLATIVKEHIESNQLCSPQLLMRCPLCVKDSCLTFRKWITSMI